MFPAGADFIHTVIDSDRCRRIANGMEFLDTTDPGWEHKIDPALLDLTLPDRCVLGMTRDNFYHILSEIVPEDTDEIEWAREHGFMEYGYARHLYLPGHPLRGMRERQWGLLTEYWLLAIKERFNSGLLSGTSSPSVLHTIE